MQLHQQALPGLSVSGTAGRSQASRNEDYRRISGAVGSELNQANY